MRLSFLIAFLLFLSITWQGMAQNLKGTIKSAKGEDIAEAHITVLNSSYGTVSDREGQFSLEIPGGTYQVAVSLLGFATRVKTVTIAESQTTTLDFTLKEKASALDEVVVTAEKQESQLMEAPLSVSSLSAQKIQDTRTWELQNLVGLVPNYQYSDLGIGYQQQLALRGVSVFSDNPAVATYIDGVNSLDIAANGFQLMDIERIEVLRGPQGTLYGRNAMGGVVNIITKQPTNKPTGFAEASVGNQGLQRYGLGMKTPLVKDKLFFGFSGQFQQQEGFYTNDLSGTLLEGSVSDGVRFGDEESYYGNLFLKWLPVRNLDLTLQVKAQQDKSIGASDYYLGAANEEIALSNPYKLTLNRTGSNQRDIVNTSLAVNYYHPSFTLTSITAYQKIQQAYENIDQDNVPFDIAHAASFADNIGDSYPQQVMSQEIRLASAQIDKPLQWTVGSYFFQQQYDQRFATTYESDAAPLLGIDPLLAPFFLPLTQVNQADLDNSGVAFFGQASYRLTAQLQLTAGLRYDYEKRKGTTSSLNIDNEETRTITQEETTLEATFHAVSPRVVLSYQLAENQHLYASYNRGFRAGGINLSLQLEGYEDFDPEYSDNYEIGYKFSAGNGKFSMTTSAFYMDWKDLQLFFDPNATAQFITANIGDVHSLGAEIEAAVVPVKNLQVDVSVGVNEATYQDFNYFGEDVSGNQTILAPKVTAFAGVQYTLPLIDKVRGVIRGEWRHIGDQYFDIANTIKQKAYNLLNTRVGVTSGHADLFFWMQNITDEQYITYASPAGTRSTLLNRPGTWGITLTGRF